MTSSSLVMGYAETLKLSSNPVAFNVLDEAHLIKITNSDL